MYDIINDEMPNIHIEVLPTVTESMYTNDRNRQASESVKCAFGFQKSQPIPIGNNYAANIDRGKAIYQEYRSSFLKVEDFADCGDAILDIAKEFAENPALIVHANPFKMAADLGRHLLTNLYDAAQTGEIADSLLFKMHIYQGFTKEIRYEYRKNFFADHRNIRYAEFNEDPPVEPVDDVAMFEFLLGSEDGSNACGLVFSPNLEEMLICFSNLSRCKNPDAVRILLIEQLSNLLIYELAAHAMANVPIPEWLEVKYRLLGRLKSIDCPKNSRRFFKGNVIGGILAKIRVDAKT